jgi:hypothetical protein
MDTSEKKIGAMPIYVGAHRTKVLLDVDERILFSVALLLVIGVFFWPCMIAAIILYFGGRVLTEKAPHFLDDVASFLFWRYQHKGRTVPDDVFAASSSLHSSPFRR